MYMKSYVEQAVVNILAAKLRSFLAVLGILIGTASVVALINSGELATEKALDQFKALGTDMLAVSVYRQSINQKQTGLSSVPISTWRKFPDLIPDIKNIAPYSTAYQPMSFSGSPLKGSIIGADESLQDLIKVKLKVGDFVSFVDRFEHFCVIGSQIHKQMMQVNFEDPLGQQIRVGKNLFTVIGVLEQTNEHGFFNEDINQAIVIPIAAMPLVNNKSEINNAVIRLKENSDVDLVTASIKKIIYKASPRLSVFVRSAKQIIESMEAQGKIFTLLLAVIGGISLLVGGIGVMNVMLVSVTERKKEIGIRKAVGAKNREIQMLFLVESVMMSLFGGIIGVLLGLVFTWVIALFSGWSFKIFILPALIGFLVSVGTGVFFGFYPAKRASQLEPIASLRAA